MCDQWSFQAFQLKLIFFFLTKEEGEEVDYLLQYNKKYNTKWKYNTLIPPRKDSWLKIQGGYKKNTI